MLKGTGCLSANEWTVTSSPITVTSGRLKCSNPVISAIDAQSILIERE